MWNEAKCNYCGDCLVECQYTDYGSAWTTGLALKMQDSLLQAGFPVFMSI
jgi:ferredoxin